MFKKQYQKILISIIFALILFSSNVLILNNAKAQSPNKFMWGTATASYQSEGEINNNDWEKFTRSSIVKDRVASNTELVNDPLHIQPARDAVKFADPEYYEKDFDNAASMGMNTFRIGIEWGSIEPENNKWDMSKIQEYKQMISAMKARGLTPVVTLNHFTLPLWIMTPPENIDLLTNNVPNTDPYFNSMRGWENAQTVSEFVEYVSFVVDHLKDQVDYWLTLNEPVSSYIGAGYVAGVWPPGFVLGGFEVKRVLHNLILAHVKAYDKITEIDNIDSDGDGTPKLVSFTHYMFAVKPALGGIFGDNSRAVRNFDYFMHDYFLNAVINGEEDINYLNTLERHNVNSPDFIIHDDWKDKLDFISPQYYRLAQVYHSIPIAARISYFGGAFDNNDKNFDGIKSDLGWPIYPEGLYQILMKIKNQWDKPMLITENGIADSEGSKRPMFITSHLQQVKKAMDDGANVIGYLHWSMTDNFEWSYNYEPRSSFGLFSIDRSGRELISETKVHSALFGGKGDDVINAGTVLPNSNCLIDDVILELVGRDGKILATTSNGQRDATSTSGLTTIGARITESHENTGNLEAKVHWFFDTGAAVRYQLHYFFKGSDCDNDGKPDFPRQKTSGADAYELIIKGSDSGILTDAALSRAIKKFGTFASDGKDIIISEKDITPPTIITPTSPVLGEATGPSGAIVNYEVSANDDQDFPIVAACNPISGSVFSIGDTEVMCQAQDSSGNIGIAKFIIRVQDTTPPDTKVTVAKDGNNLILLNNGETPSNKITIQSDGTDLVGVKGFECSLDGMQFSTCSNTVTYENLEFGNHNVQVRATDTSENIDPTPATFNWKVLTPNQATEKLLNTVTGLNDVNNGVKTSLTAHLKQAIAVLGDNKPSNDKLACIYLGSFIHSVNVHKATGLPSIPQADNLKQQAQAIQKANGCGSLLNGINGGIVLPF